MAFLKRILGEPKPQPQELETSSRTEPGDRPGPRRSGLRRRGCAGSRRARTSSSASTSGARRISSTGTSSSMRSSSRRRVAPNGWIAWVADEPESALAQLVLGRHITLWAWEARSHLRAAQVSEEQFNQFFARLDLGWRAFERAIALDPEEASTYSMSIDCAKGLQSGHQVQWELYAAAQSRRPWQVLAHTSLLQAWAPKWSHDVSMMFRFARDITSKAPRGSAVHVVIPDAHVEAWLEDQLGYWQRPGIRDEIVAAAEKSIDAPEFGATPWMPRIRSAFAYCYWLLGEHERASREFELIGPYVTGPFQFAVDPLKLATAARHRIPLR